MFKGFSNQKSKTSQGEEGEGNEVHLGLPCGRQKSLQAVDLVIILLSGRTINFGKVVSKQPTLHHLKSVI